MKPNQTADATALRQRAEENLHSQAPLVDAPLFVDDAQRLLHELQVHQLELEMQNEELIRATAEKDASLARYSDLYDFAPVGYITVSAMALILEANLTAATLLGVPRGQLIGQLLDRFILPDDQDIYRHHHIQLLNTGESHTCELRLLPTKRAQLWAQLEATTAQYGEGGEPLWRVVISEITERKNTEEKLARAYDELEARVTERTAELSAANTALAAEIEERKRAEEQSRESESLFRLLFDTAPVGICLTDLEGNILKTNQTHQKLYGYNAEDFQDMNIANCYVNPGERVHMLNAIKDLGSVRNLEIESKRKDGSRFHALLNISLTVIGGEQVLLACVQDITERKQMEQGLLDYQLQMEKANQMQSERIEEAVEELRLKDVQILQQNRQATMGEMIDNIAHQWRQPLNNLGLTIQCLCAEFDAGVMTSELINQETKVCMELISFMSQTIEDFRNFSLQDKVKKSFSIRESISKTIALVGASLKVNQIKLFVEPGVDAQITGYPNEYVQVLLNLLGNARDILIERRMANPLITLKMFCTESQAVTVIGDNGGGIGSDVIDHVFDPYVTTKEEGKGTGIGLYISKTIIEQHLGGSLTVANVEGGAEFTIVTPL